MSESERPAVQRQMVFAEGGEIEPEEGPVGTSLEDFGAAVDHRERTARIDEPSATEFGIDDRSEMTKADDSEQSELFVSADKDQRTLGGEQAAGQSKF